LLNLNLVVKESHRKPIPQRLEEIMDGQLCARQVNLMPGGHGLGATPAGALN
jgi:hypothetical protein